MTLRDLEYLIALHQLGHFGRAARHCHVSQPTLSGQLRKLEDELGVTLIERAPRGAFVTEAGAAVVAHAQRILTEVAGIERLAASLRDPFAGTLDVGFIPTIAPYLLPVLVESMRAAFPALHLVLHELQTARIIDRLRAAELDVGVLALPLGQAGLEERPVYTEAFLLAVPAGHPLADREAIPAEALHDLPMLLLEEGHCFREQALEICQRGHARTEADFRATSLETLKHMVLLGEGCTLVPELCAQAWRREGSRIATVSLAAPPPGRSVGLLYRPSTPRRPCFERLAQVIADAVRPHIDPQDAEILPITAR